MVKKSIAFLLAAVMALALFSSCKLDDVDHKKNSEVVVQIGDYTVTYGEIAEVFNAYYQFYVMYGMVDPDNPESVAQFKQSIVDSYVKNILPAYIAEQNGVELSEEEEETVQSTYDDQLNSYLDQFSAQVDASITDAEAIKEAKMDLLKADLKEKGKDYDSFTKKLYEDIRISILGNKLIAQIMEDEVKVTDDEVQKWYDDKVSAESASYAEDPTHYFELVRLNREEGGAAPVFVPEGYYYVKHIFILDENEEAPDRDLEALLEEINTKVEEVKNEADIEERIEKFQELIDEYNEDPGMETEPFATIGYLMHNSLTGKYYEEFMTAALELNEAGDISEPFKSGEGTHIMIRLHDVESGPLPFDEVKEGIHNIVLTEKQDAKYEELMAEWKETANPTIKMELLEDLGKPKENTPEPGGA